MNEFEILGVEEKLSLNEKVLESQYYARARAIHPDLSGDSAASVEKTAELNAAYRKLLNPWSRAEIMIALHLGETPRPSSMAREVAELYFELQDMDSPSALENFRLHLQKIRDEHETQRETYFREFDEATREERIRILGKLQTLVQSHRYFDSMERDLEIKSRRR